MKRILISILCILVLPCLAMAFQIDITESTYTIEDATSFTLNDVIVGSNYFWATWEWNGPKNRWDVVTFGPELSDFVHPVEESEIDILAPPSQAMTIQIDITESTYTVENATTFTLHNVIVGDNYFWATWEWNATKNKWNVVAFGPEETDCAHPVEESGIDSPGTTGHPHTLANICTANIDGVITKIGVDRWNTDTATWYIFLWDINCNLVASASVTGGTGWYFADTQDWAVTAGQQFYIGYEVSEAAGSYLYRDTYSPVDVGYYTVEYANYYPGGGGCPTYANGPLVTPVDVEFCPIEGAVMEPPDTEYNAAASQTLVETDLLPK